MKTINRLALFDTARLWIMEVAETKDGTFVGPTDEVLIHGVGTYCLEIIF